jgi:hypothetical protein
MLCATHTHTGPATADFTSIPIRKEVAYCAWLTRRIADTARNASQRMEEALFGFGVGCEPTQVFNRRYWMKDGTVRMNPGHKNPNIVRPAGPVDPDVWVLAFAAPGGIPSAVLANYALHYVGGGPGSKDQHAISADYFGDFCRILPRMSGQPLWTALSNGCCGDINNVDVNADYVEKRPYVQRKRVATILAAEVMKVLQKMPWSPQAKLGAELATLTTQRRRPTEQQLKTAEALLRTEPHGATSRHVYAREWVRLHNAPRKEDETYISAMRFGDLALVGLPGEIFVEHGLAIKRRSPFRRTCVIELANDWIGYIPTTKAFKEGSYETDLGEWSRAQPEAGDMMVETALGLLEKLKTQ